ncbi:MAG: hypothetical protein Q9191_003271 [Dirinaria sp. TL-2023a]
MASNGEIIPFKDDHPITPHAPDHYLSDEDERIAATNKRKETQFKASHGLVVAFFLWILLVLDHKSNCTSPPVEFQLQQLGDHTKGCWHPKTFDKAVILIIDALRYDFTVPHQDKPHVFHNNLRVLHETASQQPRNAFLLPFIADPPTTTLQRLKGLTTGTLPTFVESGSNFAGTAIEEDNLIEQLRVAGKTLVHLGDDTWHSLFPGYFDPNLTHSYDSFNVWDLHTVDNGVTEHLLPLLGGSNVRKWDVTFGHYLGVDHAGHRYGPDHPAMAAKLSQMDEVIRQIIDAISDETLLVVMGDHGMDTKGDHGGESDDEVEAALWMYSKKGVFGRLHDQHVEPPVTAKERPIAQIDLVPTLSLLLGLPIPFNNLGAPITEAFVGKGKPDFKNLATVNRLSAAQASGYQREYALARGFDAAAFEKSLILRDKAFALYEEIASVFQSPEGYRAAFEALMHYQKETLSAYKDLWARFDVLSMVEGIATLICAAGVLGHYARSAAVNKTAVVPLYLKKFGVFSMVGAIAGISVRSFYSITASDMILIVAGAGVTGFSTAAIQVEPESYKMPTSISTWSWLSIVSTLLPAIGFASNSYTIWEDEILLFFLGTFAMIALVSSFRQSSMPDRILGISQAALFFSLTRVASLSRLCREEQMPYCRSTYYASSNSSTSAPWQLLIPAVLALFLPLAIKLYYQRTLSYEGSAILWIGVATRIGLLGAAIYWGLDAADDNEWLTSNKPRLRTLKSVLAQLVLGLSFAAGTTMFIWAKPCISIELAPTTTGSVNSVRPPKLKTVTVSGYANMHGSRYFLLVANWLIALVLLEKPMGGGAIGALVIQILALLEIVNANNLSEAAIAPVVLGLLGNFHFFKTGHQATLASIQWESAFIPLKTIRYPWTPLLLVLNSFGAQILTTTAVPLVVLWKQPPKKPGLLGDVAKAVATYLLYHAIINLTTTMWAAWLRRHLMLYRIFSPRFMTGAAVLLVVDVIGIIVAMGGVRCNVVSISEVFGWQ